MAMRDDSAAPTSDFARLDYLFRLGVFVVGAVIVATTIVRGIAGAFGLVPPTFAPLAWSQVIGVAVLGSAGGVFVYAILDRYTDRPRRNFVVVALAVLILSTAPLWLAQQLADATMAGVAVLGVLHIVVAFVTVFLLLRMDEDDPVSTSPPPE
ncbi:MULTISPECIES: DUF6069 family protein [unclassified Haladaptatus]|uniref:DUF6069 family protein n=1 Tax=unclassified Haladaptatus TaxID=2622732 RepID=UPI0023E7D54D|nr:MULTISPECIES: DUF6069 family protein [unclassified Haladaptatus]